MPGAAMSLTIGGAFSAGANTGGCCEDQDTMPRHLALYRGLSAKCSGPVWMAGLANTATAV
jgi:hypothetical protein